MKKYEILEHKADLKIKIFGKDKEDLFRNALVGMFEAARYEGVSNLPPALRSKAGGQISKLKIKVKSIDLPSLLVDFLSEVLYLVETKKLVFEKIKFKKFSENEIEGELIGRPLKRMGVQIKAVTYHDLEIQQGKDKTWEATILFDI